MVPPLSDFSLRLPTPEQAAPREALLCRQAAPGLDIGTQLVALALQIIDLTPEVGIQALKVHVECHRRGLRHPADCVINTPYVILDYPEEAFVDYLERERCCWGRLRKGAKSYAKRFSGSLSALMGNCIRISC